MSFDLTEQCRAAESRLGPRGRLGVSFVRGQERFSYRGEETFPAASVIKVPMMIAVLQAVQAGRVSLDEVHPLAAEAVVGGAGVLMELHLGLPLTVQDLVHLMIVVSDNTASNMLMDRLGMPAHNEALQAMGLHGTVLGRKFMSDPDSPVNKNFTTPDDMRHCLESLHAGHYLNPAGTQQAIDILTRQQYREKIPLLLPLETRIGHKTGEISGVRHDMALVLIKPEPYVLVCLTHQVEDVLVADRVIAELSLWVYQNQVGVSED